MSLILAWVLAGANTFAGAAVDPGDKFVGRWELPGGASPMNFRRDGTCEIGMSASPDGKWTMIPGTYTVSQAEKLSFKAEGNGIRLTGSYFFKGDQLTDGAVLFGEGLRLWSKAAAPTPKRSEIQ